MVKTLSKLNIGQSGIIVENSLSGLTLIRFCEMGFVKGVKVTLSKTAPLGNPIEIEIMGYFVCIRTEQAAKILVRTI